MVEKRWLYSLHRDLRTWSTSSNYTCIAYIVLFLDFVPYRKNRRQKVVNLGTSRLCRRDWYSKIWQKIYQFIAFHVSHWGAWSFVWGAKPTKAPRSDVTGYQQTSISKTVLPNQVKWDIDLLDAHQWLQPFTLECNCVEQLYSVQPLPSCTTVSINALFIKSPNRNRN